MISEDEKLGLSNRFKVDVGGVDLGSWTKCDGLKVDFKTEKRTSGGQYAFIYWLPKQIEWGKVSLTRAMTAKGASTMRSWLSSKAEEYNDIGGNLAYKDGTATIALYDAHGGQIINWELRGVHVEGWKVSTFDAGKTSIALETLTLCHEGFL